MLNHREYNFLIDAFKKEDNSLFNEIGLEYENNYTQFFIDLVQYNLSNKHKIDWKIDEFHIEKSCEIFFSLKENLLEFITYNNNLGIKSELYEYLKQFENSNFEFTKEELVQGYKEIERSNLKIKFIELDNENFLTEAEIKQGIRIIERNNLKNYFKELDKVKYKEPVRLGKEFFIGLSKYAAILIVLISIIVFSTQILNKEETENVQVQNFKPSELNTILLPIPDINSLNSSNSLFQKKGLIPDFKIIVKTYDRNKALQLKKSLINKKDLTEDEKTTLKSIEKNLILFNENYEINKRECKLYLNTPKNLDLHKMSIFGLTNNDSFYYILKIGNQYFSINPNSGLKKLFYINDTRLKTILEFEIE